MDQDNEQFKVLIELCTDLCIAMISATVAPYAALFELLVEKGVLTNEEVTVRLTTEKIKPIAEAMTNKLKETISKGAKDGT